MRHPYIHPALVSVLAALAATNLVPAAASACGNSYYHEVHPRVRQLQAAETALVANALARAGRLALELFPTTRATGSVSEPLELRARRILALIAVRSGGKWPVNDALVDQGEATRKAHLAWAKGVLEGRVAREKDATDAAVELAEVLALDDATRAAAEKTLEAAAAKDLISNPYAWVTLAKLRQAKSDVKGRDAALGNCRALANDRNICALTSASGAKPST